jgi:hypothetical protein
VSFFIGSGAARLNEVEPDTFNRMPQTPIIVSTEQPLTTAQLAKHLQVTTRTLATYRAKRRIPFWKINSRNIRYRLSDVEAALQK